MNVTALDCDLSCSGCRYNLRGLSLDSACPECGQLIELTLREGSPAIRQMRAQGNNLLVLGIAILTGLLSMFTGPLGMLLAPVTMVVSAVASWRYAASTPDEPVWHRRCAVALRVMTIATCTLQILMVLAVIRSLASSRLDERLLLLLLGMLCVSWAGAGSLTFVRAIRIARQVRDRPGAIQAWALAVLIPTLFAAVGIVMMRMQDEDRESPALAITLLVLGIGTAVWASIFLVGFSIVLKRAATRQMLDGLLR